jgi:hypothetical protein
MSRRPVGGQYPLTPAERRRNAGLTEAINCHRALLQELLRELETVPWADVRRVPLSEVVQAVQVRSSVCTCMCTMHVLLYILQHAIRSEMQSVRM